MSRQTKRLSFDEERPFWTTVVTIFAVLAGLFVAVPIISYLSGLKEAEATAAIVRAADEASLSEDLVFQAKGFEDMDRFRDRDLGWDVFIDRTTDEVVVSVSYLPGNSACDGILDDQRTVIEYTEENISEPYDQLRIHSFYQNPAGWHYEVRYDRDMVAAYNGDPEIAWDWEGANVVRMPSDCLDRGDA